MRNNKNLLVIALIAVVNALGYGIIIPIIYSYSQRFGLTDFQNGLLFATFSICQFVATPIIGRLSDKYGRRPLLLVSLAGTALSFFMAAWAPSALILFLSRALDGITAGNIPVVSAVISDTTEPKDRARGFGIIGASFGFGFVFGPAISALTVGFGASVPFIIAGTISLVAVLITALILPETNKHMGEVRKGKLFDFPKLFHALTDPNVGTTLILSLVYSLAFGMFIFAFQPFATKVLGLTLNQISLTFMVFGIVGLITQVFILGRVVHRLGEKKTLNVATFLMIVAFLGMSLTRTLPAFIAASIFYALANSFVNPLIQTVLSKETDEKSQGTIQGLNASYISIGTIFGPIVGGYLAEYSIPLPLVLGSALCAICFYLSFHILKPGIRKESAF
jgi:MFS family permease